MTFLRKNKVLISTKLVQLLFLLASTAAHAFWKADCPIKNTFGNWDCMHRPRKCALSYISLGPTPTHLVIHLLTVQNRKDLLNQLLLAECEAIPLQGDSGSNVQILLPNSQPKKVAECLDVINAFEKIEPEQILEQMKTRGISLLDQLQNE